MSTTLGGIDISGVVLQNELSDSVSVVGSRTLSGRFILQKVVSNTKGRSFNLVSRGTKGIYAWFPRGTVESLNTLKDIGATQTLVYEGVSYDVVIQSIKSEALIEGYDTETDSNFLVTIKLIEV